MHITVLLLTYSRRSLTLWRKYSGDHCERLPSHTDSRVTAHSYPIARFSSVRRPDAIETSTGCPHIGCWRQLLIYAIDTSATDTRSALMRESPAGPVL